MSKIRFTKHTKNLHQQQARRDITCNQKINVLGVHETETIEMLFE